MYELYVTRKVYQYIGKSTSKSYNISLLLFCVIYSKVNSNTGKSLSAALLFAEHGEDMLCTKNILNVRNNFCTQHVLPRFELEIFMY